MRAMGLRFCLIGLLTAGAAFAQSLSFGLKGGVPLTDALHVADRSRYFSNKSPYVIGPVLEANLHVGFSVEFDILYRRLEYGSPAQTQPPSAASRTTGQAWEFPLLAKGRVPGGLVRPYLAAGFSFRRLARFEQRTDAAVSVEPQELKDRSTFGPTVGAGLELRVPLVRLSSEIRYTRWGASSFRSALGGLVSQLNQTDFLLGITF